jgi:hypothetical protein
LRRRRRFGWCRRRGFDLSRWRLLRSLTECVADAYEEQAEQKHSTHVRITSQVASGPQDISGSGGWCRGDRRQRYNRRLRPPGVSRRD